MNYQFGSANAEKLASAPWMQRKNLENMAIPQFLSEMVPHGQKPICKTDKRVFQEWRNHAIVTARTTRSNDLVLELQRVLSRVRSQEQLYASLFLKDPIDRQQGPFEPSDFTIDILLDLINLVAKDAADFANELDSRHTFDVPDRQRLKTILKDAVNNATALFARVSSQVGNSDVALTTSNELRPIYADFILSELPLVPKSEAGRILMAIRRDLDRLTSSIDIRVGQALISRRNDSLYVSLTTKKKNLCQEKGSRVAMLVLSKYGSSR